MMPISGETAEEPLSMRGERGLRGERGDRGPVGDRGDQGERGDSGTRDVRLHILDLAWGDLKWIGTALLAAMLGTWRAGVWWDAHVRADEERDRRIRQQAEQIRVLQEIGYSVHPEWTRSIFESQKER